MSDLTRGWAEDPVRFVTESYRKDPEGRPVIVDVPQARILTSLAKNDRTVVRSSHGIGKTTTAAWAASWWVATRYPALVVTLAGTWNHLEDKLWPEIHTWSRGWRLKDAFEWQTMGAYGKAAPDSWRIVASSSDKAENIEGWHSPNLLVIIDEAKAMPDELYAAIRGAMTQTSSSGARPKLLVLSTPPLAKAGWYSDLFGAKGAGWERIHISATDSPRVSREWMEEMRRDFGEDSPTYQSKVQGDIPEGAAESVVQIRWIERAQQIGPRSDRKPVVVTCDVAREGEDLTVVGRIQDGAFSIPRDSDGRPMWRASNDTMEAAGLCLRAVRENGASMLVVDDTGVGGGVTDRLIELRREKTFPESCRIIPVKFGATADREERFHSSKDELWWATRDALKTGALALPTDDELSSLALPRGSDLKAQLAAPIYEEDSKSRILVLDKRKDNREKTRGLPSKSPDLAHALILGVKFWTRAQEDTSPPPPKTTQDVMRMLYQEGLDEEKKRNKSGKSRSGSYRSARG